MQRFSLTILVVLGLVAFVGILTQHGRATTITYLSLVPLGLYVLYGIIGLIVAAVRK
jgi:hypothetical protein